MRVRCSGLNGVIEEGGMLIAVSHVSHLDPIVVSALLRRRVSWVSRIEFYQQWFMRTILYHGSRQGRADFAELLIAEYVRLYEKMRTEFGLPEDIVP